MILRKRLNPLILIFAVILAAGLSPTQSRGAEGKPIDYKIIHRPQDLALDASTSVVWLDNDRVMLRAYKPGGADKDGKYHHALYIWTIGKDKVEFYDDDDRQFILDSGSPKLCYAEGKLLRPRTSTLGEVAYLYGPLGGEKLEAHERPNWEREPNKMNQRGLNQRGHESKGSELYDLLFSFPHAIIPFDPTLFRWAKVGQVYICEIIDEKVRVNFI